MSAQINSQMPLEKYLNPETIQFLNDINTNQNSPDLKEITNNLEKDILCVEQDIIKDYILVQKDTQSLVQELNETDQILAELQNILTNFTKDFNVTQQDMESIYQQSEIYSKQLQQNKALEKEFSEYIENVLIDPQLIEDLLTKPIDDLFCQNLMILFQKLFNLKKYPQDSPSIQELKPELDRLKEKVIQRMRDFIWGQFNQLKSQNTNVQIIQQNHLIQFWKIFYFLKEFAQSIYFELSLCYSKIMNKVYYSLFKNLITSALKNSNQEHKIPIDIFLLVPSQKTFIESSFELRFKALQNQENIIIEINSNKKYSTENIYQFLLNTIVSTVIQEYTFDQNFFCLQKEECLVFYATVFQDSIILAMEKLRAVIQEIQDLIVLLIINQITLNIKNDLRQQEFQALEQFFIHIEDSIKKRFQDISLQVLDQLQIKNRKEYQPLIVFFNDETLNKNLSDLLSSLQFVLDKNQCINFEINSLQKLLLEKTFFFIKNLCQQIPEEIKQKILFIKFYYSFIEQSKTNNLILKDGIYEQEIKLDELFDQYNQIILQNKFKFIYECVKEQKIETKELEETIKGFNANFQITFSSIKGQIKQNFQNQSLQIKIFKNLNENFLELYEKFNQTIITKESSLTKLVIQIHKINLELKTILEI